MQRNATKFSGGKHHGCNARNHRLWTRGLYAKPVTQDHSALHGQIVVVLHDGGPTSIDHFSHVIDGGWD